ncbi:hypothetical protein B0H14DRAFT_2693528 [Mycena olivaceomarginata]|nr:hypothetical protein B0H14DRAFT_2693528 [Mycena olivaceomarginata]
MSLFGHVPASYVMLSPMRQVLGGGTRVVPAATSLHSTSPRTSRIPTSHRAPCRPALRLRHRVHVPLRITNSIFPLRLLLLTKIRSLPPSPRVFTPLHTFYILMLHRATGYPAHRPRCRLRFSLHIPTSTLHLCLLPVAKIDRAAASCAVGTGKHRLHPRFCPRTLELISNKLAMFNFDFRLVSFDGSPLPMTRHPSGVAARLLSPRGPSSHPARASPRSPSTSPGSSKLNPPHIRRVPCTPIANHLPSAIPIANLNRSHTSHSPVEPPVRISSPDHQTLKSNPPHVTAAAANRPRTIEPSVDSNPPHVSPPPSPVHPRPIPHSDHSGVSSIPHFPPVERLRSPPIYLPVRLPFPDSKPPTDAASENSSPHIALNIFELLFISPPIRNELRKLIDTMDRLNVGYEIPSCPSLRKVFYRILDQIMESLSSVR